MATLYVMLPETRVEDALNLTHSGVYQRAMKLARNEAAKRCPESVVVGSDGRDAGRKDLDFFLFNASTRNMSDFSYFSGGRRPEQLANCDGGEADVDRCFEVATSRASPLASALAAADRERIARAAQSRELAVAEKARAERQAAHNKVLPAGVEEVSLQQLSLNPYVYQGKIVAVLVQFEGMTSASTATFSGRGGGLLVQGVPATRFTGRQAVMLRARVQGQTEQVVLGTKVAVPLLTFVDVYFCKQADCSEIRP